MHHAKLVLSIAGLIIALVGTAAIADDKADLSGAADLIKARTDYQRHLTEARKAQAEIQLIEAEAQLARAEADKNYAEAAYLRVKADHLRVFLQMMQEEYARIRREEAEIKMRIYDVRAHVDLCGALADGITHHGGFQCLEYFRRYLVSFSLQKKMLFDEKVEALPAEEFVPNYQGIRVEPFPGGNVGQLILFAQARDFSFAPFGKAHTQIIMFLDAISVAAQAKIREYQNYIDGIRAGRLDVFKLPND